MTLAATLVVAPAAGSTALAASKKNNLVVSVTTSSGKSTISYVIGSGSGASSKVISGAKSTWKKKKTVNTSKYGLATVSAIAESGGKVTCKITLNGKVLDKASARGQFSTATCSADWGI